LSQFWHESLSTGIILSASGFNRRSFSERTSSRGNPVALPS
jgi:hypothetical protein